MHGTLCVNVGDAPAGTVRAAAIPLEQAKGFLRQRGTFPELAQKQVNAVRRLSHSQHLTVFPLRFPFLHTAISVSMAFRASS